MKHISLFIAIAMLAACGQGDQPKQAPEAAVEHAGLYPGETPAVRALVNKWADHHNVPRSLVHRVIQRESDYRAHARNGPYFGMMQILPATARGMGFSGPDHALLDADTNLQFAVKYLRGAWLLADGNEVRAVQFYARGYYYDARDRCMLVETGLRTREVRKDCK